MLAPEDAKWVKSTANELNNLLQVISEAGQYLGKFAGESDEAGRYLEMMHMSIDRAASVTRLMLTRLGETTSPTPAMETTLPPSPLPAVRPEPAPELPRPVRQPVKTEEIEGVTVVNPLGVREMVLIVDDEDYVALLAQRVLIDEGYKVVTARDGFQAVKIYAQFQHRIDLVILDFTMPIMDGSETFDELLAINPRVPVVLSSGFAEQEKVKAMLAKGLRGFMPKPYTQQKLLSQVRLTLDALKNESRKPREDGA